MHSGSNSSGSWAVMRQPGGDGAALGQRQNGLANASNRPTHPLPRDDYNTLMWEGKRLNILRAPEDLKKVISKDDATVLKKVSFTLGAADNRPIALDLVAHPSWTNPTHYEITGYGFKEPIRDEFFAKVKSINSEHTGAIVDVYVNLANAPSVVVRVRASPSEVQAVYPAQFAGGPLAIQQPILVYQSDLAPHSGSRSGRGRQRNHRNEASESDSASDSQASEEDSGYEKKSRNRDRKRQDGSPPRKNKKRKGGLLGWLS